MYRSTIFLFFALFATVFGAYQPTGCNRGQKLKDVIMIRDQFTHEKLVCNWYLSNKRNIVPTAKTFVDVKSKRAIKRFSNACECISKRRQSNKPTVKRFRPDGYTPKCAEGARKLLLKEVEQPLNFCNMWNQQSWRKPTAVPFGGNLSARQVYNACVCVAERRASSTSTEPTSTDESTAEPTEEPTSTDESTSEPTADPTSDVTTTTDAATTTADVTTTAPLIVLPTTTIDLLPTTTSDSTTTTSTTQQTSTATSTTTSTTTEQATTTSTTTVTTTITATPTFSTTETSTSSSSSSSTSPGSMNKRQAVAHAGRQYSNAGKRGVLLDN